MNNKNGKIHIILANEITSINTYLIARCIENKLVGTIAFINSEKDFNKILKELKEIEKPLEVYLYIINKNSIVRTKYFKGCGKKEFIIFETKLIDQKENTPKVKYQVTN